MNPLADLYPAVRDRIVHPVCIAGGPVRPVAQFAARIGGDVVCHQFDLYQTSRLKEVLAEEGATAATVAATADLWDLPARFRTVVLPAHYDSDRELKIDLVEQSWHVLEPGGRFIALSENRKDTLFAKLIKKIYGRCSESPSARAGMAFWAEKDGTKPRDRRRHEVSFHARLGDAPSMNILCRPGLFSYGRFDAGSRAMIEVADLRSGDRVLDLGCGVGAVGCLASTRIGETGHVTFIDSNLRATALSELNAKANGVRNFDARAAAHLEGLPAAGFDVVLANPPYYANAEIARLFIGTARHVLAPGGRFYYVTRMPTATVPDVFELFGDCSVIENRGYSVITAGKPADE